MLRRVGCSKRKKGVFIDVFVTHFHSAKRCGQKDLMEESAMKFNRFRTFSPFLSNLVIGLTF